MLRLILLIASYLLGSIPFGFLIARGAKGIDIRHFGSGNIGATNVFRVVGKAWGILVFILDFLKGFLPLLAVKIFIPQAPNYIFILAAFLAVGGHNWTPFLKFKGGKGVATSFGAVSGLSLIFPKLGMILILTICSWVIFFLIFRYVSLASIIASFTFFMFSLIFSQPGEIKIASFFLFIFIIIRHYKNIKRLIDKKEHRL